MVYYLFFLIFIIISLLCYNFYTQNNSRGKLANKLPGPNKLPLLGNLLQIQTTPVKLFKLLRKWQQTFTPVYRIWLGTMPVIVISHPDDLEIFLTNPKHINKELAYELLYPWLNTGLLTSGAKKWHQRRKILTKAFHFNILQKYMQITNEQGEKTVINTKLEGKEVNKCLFPFCSKYTLNIICESAMGVSLDNNEESAQKYKRAVYQMGEIILYRVIRPYITNWLLPLFPKLNSELKRVLEDLGSFTNKIVKNRREFHQSTNYTLLDQLNEDENSKTEYNETSIGTKKKLCMLDLLLESEKNGLIDDVGIKEEVSTFVFEGHDTTAVCLCFTILLLAENEDVQKKARMEIEGILNSKNGKLETSDLQEMTYLERCIKESLRLYPSVPMITRYVLEDVKLKHCVIPKNTNILLDLVSTHRIPEFWPEPNKFDPDRFLIEEVKKRHAFAYVPFSAGPRNCIGQKFAIMEIKSLLANILYNFYIEPIDRLSDCNLFSELVLRIDKPVYTKFIRIDRA